VDKKAWQLIQIRRAQAMRAALQQRSRLAGSIVSYPIPYALTATALQRQAIARKQAALRERGALAVGAYPVPYGVLAAAALQRQAVAKMQARALQRADPARFAAMQKQAAALQRQAIARKQAALRERAALAVGAYPVPYGVLAAAALQRQAVAKMRARALQRADPARFAAMQKQAAAARMRAAALAAQLDVKVYPLPYTGLGAAALQRQALARMHAARLQQADPVRFAAAQRQAVVARRMQAAALQAQLGIAYPIPYRGLVGAALQRQTAAAQLKASQSRRSAEIKKRLLQVQRARAQRAKKRR
jgi:hypothetical protein